MKCKNLELKDPPPPGLQFKAASITKYQQLKRININLDSFLTFAGNIYGSANFFASTSVQIVL